MACLETYATVRVFSASISPDEVESILNIPATEKRPIEQTSPYRHRREMHGWFWSTQHLSDSQDNTAHLAAIIEALTPRAEGLQRLQSMGCSTDIFCYWVSTGQGGPELDVQTMRALCSLNLPVSWDMYFTEEFEVRHSQLAINPEQVARANAGSASG